MNLLSVYNLSKQMGGKLLFKELSFGIHYKERVALIAPNGSGKTTLLRILNEELLPDTGLVTFRQGLKKTFCTSNRPLT